MSLEIKIVQTSLEKKPLPLKVILGADFLYGAYDEGWRLHTGVKNEKDLVCYMPMQLARGIAVKWSEDEVDMVSIRALIPTAAAELRALYEMVYRICEYWQCELLIDDRPMDVEEFFDDFSGILMFNQNSLTNMAKSVINGENDEVTLFAVNWPLVMGKNEAEAFIAEPTYFSKWLHDKQKIDAHFANPAFYRTEDGVIGRYALAEETRCILPIKPYVPYGYDDPETGELIQCENFGMLLYDIKKGENIGDLEYKDFITKVRRHFSAKIKRYDGNHILLEPLTIEDLNKLSTLE